MKLKWISIFLLNCITICCVAQTAGYKFYCLLDSITTAGFYTINLSPEINAHVKTDYSDIRIVNKEGKWIPHIVSSSASNKVNERKSVSLKFSIIENNKVSTVLLIEPAKNTLSNIGLTIKNTAVKRFCALSGSDNKEDWFVINDSVLLAPIANETSSLSMLRINFPQSNYAYVRVTVYNNNKDPFNIQNVLQYTTADSLPQNKMVQNPASAIVQKDSGKMSYVQINQHAAYHFNYINIKLNGPTYFYRKMEVYIPDTGNTTLSHPGKLIQSFTISNNNTLQFKVPLLNTPILYLLIYNEDNLPIAVTEVQTACDYTYLIAYIEKGVSYKLIMGNPVATPPDYDLSNINKILPADTTRYLSAAKPIAFAEKAAIPLREKNNKWVLWLAIASALLILLLYTKKMISEVDKIKQDDSI